MPTDAANVGTPAGLVELFGSQAWAMEPKALTAFVCNVARLYAASPAVEGDRVEQAREAARAPRVAGSVDGATAVVRLNGPILKNGNWVLEYFGIQYVSTVAVGRVLRELDARPDVGQIVLWIDSPGGTVEGTQELADLIAEVRETTPVLAYISDTGASGAYWLASQANSIEANDTALVGSIGVYSVMTDWSRLYEEAGVKVHVIRSTPLKGAGYPGDKVSDAQIADGQRIVDALAAKFIEAVAAGRGLTLEAAQAVAVGTVWLAAEAQEKGLVDGVSNWAEFLPRVVAGGAAGTSTQEAGSMAGEQDKKALQPYTAGELQAAYPEQVAALCKEAASAAVAAERERCSGIVKAQVSSSDEQTRLALGAIEKGQTVAEADSAMKGAELERLRKGGAKAVGASDGDSPSEPGGDSEAAWKAAWGKNAELRAEFGGDEVAYLAYCKAKKEGSFRVR
ncbi:MAG TPA: S49 family peptidase [Planctomycetota bacterium]|nr:S49 family peptidase [Planctomycetota bacterium]HRT95531.1 S49 family peptidase [Planctomycetota bacterium]